MKYLKTTALPIFIVGIWINISEFIRNEIFIKSYWVKHYQSLNLTFPSEPINGIGWIIWGFSFAVTIFILSKKYNLLQTTLLSWFMAFCMMWIVIWNLDVLPIGILWIAVPLSLLESFIGVLLCKKLPVKRG